MVAVELYPQAAAGVGCAASATVVHDYDSGNIGPTYGWITWRTKYKVYSFEATAANGWIFDHWEQDFNWKPYGYDTVETQETCSHTANPWQTTSSSATSKETTVDELLDCMQARADLPYYESTRNITRLVAVFVEDQHGDITVTTEADPVAGGTTSPASETHHYAGNPSTTFTLTATPNVGYVFEKWLHNGSEYSLNAQTTVTLYFSSSAQTEHYVAKFRISDKILHGANGTILHGSGGTILRGG